MNLQQYKFIIASGCSYATTLSSLDNTKLNVKLDTTDDVIFIQIGCASQGASWAHDSIVYAVEKLFELGVSSENIYCFVEWTQIDRITVNQSNNLHTFFDENTLKTDYQQYHIKGNNPTITSLIYDKLKIRSLTDVHNIMSIDGLFYINPRHTNPYDVSKFNNIEFDFYFNILNDYELRIPFETKIKNYLDNILNLQRFLKTNRILYNFAKMQSQFSGWSIDDDNVIHKYEIHNNKPATIIDKSNIRINPNYKEDLNISETDDLIKLFPQFKPLFDKIDFSNWWFYNKDGYRYGGIDEYALNEFGMYGFLATDYDIRMDTDVDVSHIIPTFSYHPNAFIHVLLTNDMMFNNPFFKVSDDSIERIKTMVNEDIESKNRTKHGLAISKIELQKHIVII